jgi:hypothetical protein
MAAIGLWAVISPAQGCLRHHHHLFFYPFCVCVGVGSVLCAALSVRDVCVYALSLRAGAYFGMRADAGRRSQRLCGYAGTAARLASSATIPTTGRIPPLAVRTHVNLNRIKSMYRA